MEIRYHSTRDKSTYFTASEAILKGLCSDGGLFVPETVPKLPLAPKDMAGMSYQEIAFLILREYLGDFTDDEIRRCVTKAYGNRFDTREIAPLKKAGSLWYLELFHGPTIAFKDMALSILPHLLTVSAKKQKITEEIVILTATSGDTGKAAMAGFADVPGTRIIVFYPKGGVSPMQERQMVTQRGENTAVVAVEGNFDDAQTGVKAMFEDRDLAEELSGKGFRFSSANSINIGRLVPQIVYYVNAYVRLLERGAIAEGEPVNFAVPTGNFGNILAAWYAARMGLPVRKLICASNKNKVLYDFFRTGVYDRNRDFYQTSSPSMDILISSNLERMLYISSGEDDAKVRQFMSQLKESGRYAVTPEMRKELSFFASGYASEEDCAQAIARTYRENNYVIDTHTACAVSVSEAYQKEAGDGTVTVVASTASPYKFASSVLKAIESGYEGESDQILVNELRRISGTDIPPAVTDALSAPVLHMRTCSIDGMEASVREILGIR